MAQPMIKRYSSTKTTFHVIFGDITQITADVVVTGEGCNPQKLSLVTKSLMNVLPQFAEKRNQLIKDKGRHLHLWNVYTSKLETNFLYKFAIHAVLDKAWNDCWLSNMKSLYKKIFAAADKLKITSVALPLLGSGKADTGRSESVKAVITSILAYYPTYLTDIMLVTNDPKVLEMVDAQIEFEQSGISDYSNPGFFKKVYSAVCSGLKTLTSPFGVDENPNMTYNGSCQTSERGHGRHNRQNKRHQSSKRHDSCHDSKGQKSGNVDGTGGQQGQRKEKSPMEIAIQKSMEDEAQRKKRIADEKYKVQTVLQKSKAEAGGGKRHLHRKTHGARYVEDDALLLLGIQNSKEDVGGDLTNGASPTDDSDVHPHSDEVGGSLSEDSADDSSDIEVLTEEETEASGHSHSRQAVGESIVDKMRDNKTESIHAFVCPICLCVITEPKQLERCGHVFCKGCIDRSFKDFKPVCPSCNMVYGVIIGNQPEGNMDVGFSSQSLPGYEHHGTITITYSFPSGIQKAGHPSPGQPYKGTTRRAYLPDCQEGKEILDLLRTAFKQKLTFTIGRSTTTGQEGVVTWNDIHHKTNMDGGPTKFGYPDPTYLTRIRDELASKGLTK